MMDSPFFRSYWQPRYSSALSVSSREIPVQGNTKANTNTKPSHKVISIPVHYVGSERIRSNSALKIQKVLRGFLVRKNMKRITAIRNEVDEIERRVSGQETLELIKKDGKERLRVNETIMNLLLRLDSVRSIDSGIKACRKSVINKAIALQEKVDQISSADHTVNAECFSEPLEVKDSMHGGNVSQEQNLELQCEAAQDISEGQPSQNQDKTPQHVNAGSDSNSIADDPTSELRQHVELVPSAGPLVAEIVPNAESEVASQSPKLEALIDTHSPSLEDEGQIEIEAKQNDIKDSAHEASYGSDSAEESVGTSRSAEQSGTSTAAKTSLIEESEENSSVKEKNGTNVVQFDEPGKHVEENFEFGRGDEQNRSRDLLERMIQDNERMMNLMAQLFEKNERQTRLLSSLSNRVEQLEKAFACEKSRRKKRRNAAGIADASDKCGKR